MVTRLLIGLLLSTLSALCTAEERYALLIGVSGYPSLPIERRLKGPANDVLRMQQVLIGRGFDAKNIRVLAHGVGGAVADPTREKILAELSSLSERVVRGDFVFVEFAGHGGQEPWTTASKPRREPDGLNEIFLPYDIGKWDDKLDAVKNAITDVEIGAALGKIQDKGAFVWAVFDTCHAAGMTRGERLESDAVERAVLPTDLGIPEVAYTQGRQAEAKAREQEKNSSRGAENAKPRGRYVYLYASQKWESTHEKPRGDSGTVYGDLTWNLAAALSGAPNLTYRQLGEYLLQMYSGQNIKSKTPTWEGSGLETPIFGQEDGARVWQWPIEGRDTEWKIAAGKLNQLAVDDLFAIYPSAAARNDEIIGYARARQVDVLRTVLAPTAYRDRPKPERIPDMAVARLVEGNYSFVLRVARPPTPDKGSGAARKRVLAAIDNLKKSPPAGLRVEWVAASEAADVRLVVADAQLWFLPADGELKPVGIGKTPSIGLDRADAEWRADFGNILVSAAKAVNLRRLAAKAAGTEEFQPELDIKVQVTGANGDRTYSLLDVPEVGQGDQVHMTLNNKHHHALDITVFGIDARYGITLLYPATDDEILESRLQMKGNIRFPTGEGIQFNCAKCGQPTFGKESFIFVVVEALPGTVKEDLSFYQQASIPVRKGLRGGPLSQLLTEAGFGTQTQGMRGQLRNVAIRSMDYVVREPGGAPP